MISVLIGGTAIAQKTNEFSVKQTVDYGLKNAVQVKNALIDIKSQQQTNREFTANAYPQLTAGVSATHYFNIPVQTLPNFISPATYQVLVDEGVKNGSGTTITMPNGGDFGVIAAQFGSPWTAGASVDLSQIIFDGQVFVGLQARGAAMDLAKKTAEVTQEQIKANIYKIYYQLVVGKKQLTNIDANIERFTKLLNDTKEIYKNGFAEKLDVDKVQVTLSNLQTEKERIQNQLEAGNAGLKFLINMPQKEILVLTDTLSEDEIKANLLDTVYKYEDRKEIQLLNVATKLNGYNVKRYQLSRLPSVVAFGSYGKNAQRQKFDFFNKGDWFTTSLVGVKIAVPIFDGFARSARIENAKLAVQKLKNNMEATKESIDYDVTTARIKMKSAIITMDNQKKNTELAEKVFNSTKKKYEQGLGSNQEIYNAQTELKVAQTNYYSSLYDAITAKIDWLKAVGKL
ncbi:TolC family protein [Ferruginibacter lapsinanis]|uniref:TolC family protein n=1 Tax=Ferruginibacter lapsinanis TaxID=563172 RepID=UPI001E4F7E29|nr:TolC family protein [Ferruginibacter lapsinanis]UEG51058.1 TolC family protein [Ferruginibacter lapsinanis]